MAVKPIPEGYRAVTPYLIVDNAAKAIEFYQQAFGAQERMRFAGPEGRVMHAELDIGDSVVMLADEVPNMDCYSPLAQGGTGARGFSLLLYVPDVDKQFAQALDAGAKSLRPVQDQFYGDRSGTLQDPFGHVWSLATHKEDLTPEEIGRRAQEFMQKNP
jgi:PhnB protein